MLGPPGDESAMAKTSGKKKRTQPFLPRHAYTQGGLDGLCGIYATINALQHLRGRGLEEAPAAALFKHLIGAVRGKLPELLWDGTGMPELRKILDAADEWARLHYGFALARGEPLLKRAPKNDDLYWTRLGELLTAPDRVLLVGLKEPWEHWTVLTNVTPRTLRFFDSLSIKVARRGDVSLRAGSTYRIDPHQVFLLRRIDLQKKAAAPRDLPA